jgi:toxin ParE1/3/4
MVPKLQREDILEVFLRTHRIVYRVREQTIDVLTVFEGYRRFDTTDPPELDQ